MKRGSEGNRDTVLTFSEQVSLLSTLTPVAENCDTYTARLIQSGFDGFACWQQFSSSFCEPEEISLHKKCMAEIAKRRMSRPDGIAPYLFEQSGGHKSGVLDGEQGAKNHRNLVEKQSDPCDRRLRQIQKTSPSEYDERRQALWRAFEAKREAEISIHAPEISKTHRFTSSECTEFLLECLFDTLGPLGFEHDLLRSKKFFPVFSKPMHGLWDLSWSLKSDRNVRLLPAYGDKQVEPRIELDLTVALRSATSRGFVSVPIGFKHLDIMLIRYGAVVPGFDWAYSHFRHLAELKTIVVARVFLYSIIAPFIESRMAVELAALRKHKKPSGS